LVPRELRVIRSKEIVPKELDKGFWSKRLITGSSTGSPKFMLSMVSLDAGATSTDCYPDKDEALFILKGKLRIQWKKNKRNLSSGDSVFIPMSTTTTIKNLSKTSRAKLVAVIAPSKTKKELQISIG